MMEVLGGEERGGREAHSANGDYFVEVVDIDMYKDSVQSCQDLLAHSNKLLGEGSTWREGGEEGGREGGRGGGR